MAAYMQFFITSLMMCTQKTTVDSTDYHTNKHQVKDTSLQIEDKNNNLLVICKNQKRTATSKEERIVNVSSKNAYQQR
jgi:maltodextrin utilization protein YvdJ